MKKEELISVVVPVYNAGRYAEKLVETLQAQTYKQMEVIVVDDGSADGTDQIIGGLVQEDPRFRVYRKENGGAAAARNYGMDRAGGAYIAFVDADDYFFPEYLQFLYDLITEYEADISCCAVYKMWDTEKMPDFPGVSGTERKSVFTGQEALEDFLYRNKITAYSCAKLFKKEILQGVRQPEHIAFGEDFFFMEQLLSKCPKAVYSDRELYIYYQHQKSVTHGSLNVKKYKDSWEEHIKLVSKYEGEANRRLLEAARAKCFIFAIDCCCRVWSTKEAEGKPFRKELEETVKSLRKHVWNNPKCSRMNRLLALLSYISVPFMIQLCRLFIYLKAALRFEVRKPL